MTLRREKILKQIILDYITTAQPVGSSKLSKLFNLSPATIRNEMAFMEREGYIYQPHISAGRIPSEKGYQHFISHFLKKEDIPDDQKKQLQYSFSQDHFENDVKGMAKLMAQFSIQTIIVAFKYNDVFYTGISHLFSKPEFYDVQIAIDLSCIIDDLNDSIYDIFGNVSNDIEIFIGEDNPFGKHCSALLTKYQNDQNEGLIGILGPMRMKYGYNISLLEYCRDMISREY